MKTIIYIDGYNLFYGCLKHSRDKWLDLYRLFVGVLNAQQPATQLVKIKFFTADIKAKVASHGHEAMLAQQDYHRALMTLYPNQLEIQKGFYTLEKARLLAYQQPPDKNQRVDVWKLEEKQTDVNIALTAYRDAARSDVEQLVFVSNDTDLEPALAAIREDFGNRHIIGLILPMRKTPAGIHHRAGNQRLSALADWTRRYLTDEELAAAQLPVMIPTQKKPIRKPAYW